MTTIVHHDGVLYTDRMITKFIVPLKSKEGTKVFVSSDNQFAFAKTGQIITEEIMVKTENLYRRLLEVLSVGISADALLKEHALTPEMCEELDHHSNVILITKKRAFGLNSAEIHDITEETYGIGTGGRYFLGMLDGGLTPEEAFAKINDLDCFSGYGFDKVSRSDLDDFIIKG